MSGLVGRYINSYGREGFSGPSLPPPPLYVPELKAELGFDSPKTPSNG